MYRLTAERIADMKFTHWLSSSDLEDLARFGYGLGAEDVQNLHDIAQLERYGWNAVSADQVWECASYIAEHISEDTLNNVADVTGHEPSRDDVQIIGAIADDILDGCIKTFID